MIDPVIAQADSAVHAALHRTVQGVHDGQHQGRESRIADRAVLAHPEPAVRLLAAVKRRDVPDPFADVLPSAAFVDFLGIRRGFLTGAVSLLFNRDKQ